ncbi:MAG TPA: hypothetical protein VGD67_18370, partial [Pseudonocardiaceae bacterium]
MTSGRRRATGGGGPGLRDLRGSLLVQASPDDAAQIAPWADRPGGGLVLTGRDGLAAARELLASGVRCPVLVDAARYMQVRTHRRSQLSESWIDWQRSAGLPVALTDSGYVGQGDGDGLCSVLTQAAAFGPGVVAVLPLHASWLVDDIDRLCAEVAAAEIPVALVVEHNADPLGHLPMVDGLLRLLMLGVPVMLLRADVSAVGVLCFGGHAVAVGLRESMRRGPTRRPRQDRPGVLVPQLLRFVESQRLAGPGAAALWHCDCEVCADPDLARSGRHGLGDE